MEQSQVNMDSRNVLSLPVEILVYIASFLTDVRDKVKLRYVSRRLRSISETPSLWRKFVWPYYDRLEERCLCKLLKVCGKNILQLSFPHHVMPSKLVKFLQYCGNVTHLSLSQETKLNLEQLTKTLQHMKSLSVLKIRLSIGITSLLQLTSTASSNVEDLTVYVRGCYPDDWYLCNLHEWVVNNSAPNNLNVVAFGYYDSLLLNLIHGWSQWNAELPADRMACLRLYTYESIYLPLNLSLSLPVLQLQYGRTARLPLVKPSKFGLLGLRDDLLLLTDCTCKSKTIHKVKLVSFPIRDPLNSSITDLTFVTYFDVGPTERHLYAGHLEQLAMACPNLVWLNLRSNSHCLQSLQGLQVISRCCQKLRGLNLLYVPLKNIQGQMKLWDILSSMKLTQLAVELCTLKPLRKRDTSKLISRFQQCSSLQALETYSDFCMDCGIIDDGRPFLLSHFPSLESCRLSSEQPQSAQEIIATCQGLKFFKCNCIQYLILSSVYNWSLEQLCIGSEDTDLDDTFLDTVSAHGGLVHVVLSINSVPSEGITALVENSHKLITCNIFTVTQVYDSEGMKVNLKGLKAKLKGKFSRRKLFTCGNLRLVQENSTYIHYLDEFFEDTDFVQFNGCTQFS